MTKLLDSQLTCARCGAPLDEIHQVLDVDRGVVQFAADGWAPIVDHEVLNCRHGHRFVAVYEQRAHWLRVLVGAGAPLPDVERDGEIGGLRAIA